MQEKIDILKYDVLILDESHYIRNSGALWNGIDYLISKNEQGTNKLKIFMTATPIFNNSKDYDNITYFLTLNNQEYITTTTLQGEANCYDFLLNIKTHLTQLKGIEKDIIEDIYSTYNEYNNWGFNVTKSKYKYLTGFLKRISASSIYSLKKFVNKRSEFDSEDYNELKNFNCELTDLNELCKQWSEQGDSKFMQLQQLLKDLSKNQPSFKAVIFSCFLDTCHYLESRLKSKYNVYTITGKDNPKKVIQSKLNFEKKDGKSAILICSDAAKEGHNLQFCQYLIHYDFPYTPAALGQRNGRIYRKGQERKPQAFYMNVENSYDDRLFGEIIVAKSYVIRELSDEGKVSILNVLPQDAEVYVEKCLNTYFKECVESRKQDWLENKENKAKAIPDNNYFERQEFRFQLLKKFTYMDENDEKKIRKWSNLKFKKLYNQENADYIDLFSKIFLQSQDSARDMEKLQEYYKSQYQTEEKQCKKIFFDNEDISFADNCNLVTNPYNPKHYLFCQDMLHNSENAISMKAYKEQFYPLVLMQRESR